MNMNGNENGCASVISPLSSKKDVGEPLETEEYFIHESNIKQVLN